MITRISLVAATLVFTAANAFASQLQYSQSFTFPNGTTNLGDGTTIGSTDGINSVQSNALRMTQDGVGNTASSFRIPAQPGSSLGWTATFDITMIDAAGGGQPADGFSFNYGALPARTGSGLGNPAGDGSAENGWGGVEHIAFEFDTWMVPDAEHGYNISSNVGGVQSTHPDHAFSNVNLISDGGSVSGSATLTWDPVNGASMTVSGLENGVVFSNVAVPGFVANDAYGFGFSARTGGATETLFIDNVQIFTNSASTPEPSTAILAVLGALGLGLTRRRRRR